MHCMVTVFKSVEWKAHSQFYSGAFSDSDRAIAVGNEHATVNYEITMVKQHLHQGVSAQFIPCRFKPVGETGYIL